MGLSATGCDIDLHVAMIGTVVFSSTPHDDGFGVSDGG
jgi:hypothetical protein